VRLSCRHVDLYRSNKRSILIVMVIGDEYVAIRNLDEE